MTELTQLLIGIGIGVVLVLCGVGAGCALMWVKGEQLRRRRRDRVVTPVCGCRHHISFHDDEEGCHFIVAGDYHTATHECGCRRYVGPEAPPQYTAELT